MSDWTYNACISAGRPQNVQRMEELCGPLHWYVRDEDYDSYRAAGARKIFAGGGLIAARNWAMEHAFERKMPCVQVSDDLRKLQRAVLVDATTIGGPQESVKSAEPLLFEEAINLMNREASRSLAMMVGVAPTDNPFYWNPNPRTRKPKFIVGDLILVFPNPLRFDPNLRLKEDYDYTCQHIAKYSTVGRADEVLASFDHRTNAGGAVNYRTPELEQEAIAYLKSKWGRMVQDNPRRPNEILLVT